MGGCARPEPGTPVLFAMFLKRNGPGEVTRGIEHLDSLYSYAMVLTQNHTAAEDLVQNDPRLRCQGDRTPSFGIEYEDMVLSKSCVIFGSSRHIANAYSVHL
jgi:hypothetical protein